MPDAPVVTRMQTLIEQWEAVADRRAVFLTCYRMMTRNMFQAIAQGEFNDPDWVERLLHRFADYYFEALEAYDRQPEAAPQVWQTAHGAARQPNTRPLQLLLLGVNAHINYDLVLTLVDMLAAEWAGLSEPQLAQRYADHCHVNEVIGRTIDAVQDEVLEPAMPLMELIDDLMGQVDEILISRLLTHWREQVWQNAARLLDTPQPDEQTVLIRRVEADAVRLGEVIALRRRRA